MNIREAFHIYKILEDYSKKYIAFDYTPKFRIPLNYYLSYQEINSILSENSTLIQALYNRDESEISNILKCEDILIDEFDSAQIDENTYKDNKGIKATPLPIQARYVLKAWNLIRINGSKNDKLKLIETFNKKAFNLSFFPQITKMCLAFEEDSFCQIAIEVFKIMKEKEQFFLYYKILAYYFRLKKIASLKDKAIEISYQYLNNLDTNKQIIYEIYSYLENNLIKK